MPTWINLAAQESNGHSASECRRKLTKWMWRLTWATRWNGWTWRIETTHVWPDFCCGYTNPACTRSLEMKWFGTRNSFFLSRIRVYNRLPIGKSIWKFFPFGTSATVRSNSDWLPKTLDEFNSMCLPKIFVYSYAPTFQPGMKLVQYPKKGNCLWGRAYEKWMGL